MQWLFLDMIRFKQSRNKRKEFISILFLYTKITQEKPNIFEENPITINNFIAQCYIIQLN